MGDDASLYFAILTGIVITIGAVMSMLTVDRFGCGFLFLEAGIQMVICHVLISILLALKFGKGEILPIGYGVGLMLLIYVFTMAFGWSWGPLGWLVPSELFPLEIRSVGQSIVICVNLFFITAMAQSFLALLCNLKYGIFLLFASLMVIMSLFVYFLLPETKNVFIEEMRFEWAKH